MPKRPPKSGAGLNTEDTVIIVMLAAALVAVLITLAYIVTD